MMKVTNFRKLFIITIFISVVILMAFYIDEIQNFIKSPYHFVPSNVTTFKYRQEIANKIVKHPNVSRSIESNWTYECVLNRCTRKSFLNKNQSQASFESCSRTCGKILKLWPNPLKSTFTPSIEIFLLSDIQYQIETSFTNVVDMIHKTMHEFFKDLQQIIVSSGGNFNKSENSENEAFAGSEKMLVNITIEITENDSTLLTLDTNECYKLTTATSQSTVNVKISGKSFFGARHGIETLQQIIWYDGFLKKLRILSSITVDDCPKFRYRGLMLDTSRNYFSIETIKRIITGMSHVKLNRLHWHITDSQSFPFVSNKYPELSIYGAYSPHEVYRHEDIQEIVDFASIRGIQIIPEIDAPAHMGNGWQWGPDKGLGNLSLCINQQPWMSYCGEPPCGQMNPINNNSYDILESLYEELIHLTKTTDFFHLGGDEVNFECWRQHFKNDNLNELWCKFMIEAQKRMIKANNYKTIKYGTIWNSDWAKMKCLSPANFSIQVWLAQPSQMRQLIREKYNIIISHVDAWYLDCGFGTWRNTKGEGVCPPFKAWYTMYNYKPWDTLKLDNTEKRQILGGEVCMWTEQVNEDSIDTRLWPRVAAFAERLWSDIDMSKVTVKRFSLFQQRFRDLGLKADAIFPKYCAQNEEECM